METTSHPHSALRRRFGRLLRRLSGVPSYDKLFFLHIPKTAGTAFGRVLKASVPEDRFFEHMESRQELFWSVQRDGKPFFLSGHFYFNDTREIIDRSDVFSLTVLRKPSEQFISHLRWVKFVGSPNYNGVIPPAMIDLARQLWQTPLSDVGAVGSIIDCEIGRRLFDNLHVQYLTKAMDRPVDKRHLQDAIVNLYSFDLVLTLERLNQLRWFLKMYFPDLRDITVTNVAPVNDQLDRHDPAVIDLIQKYTLYDQTLYNAADRQALSRANNAPALFRRRARFPAA
jgi:hypothetical protein